MDDDTLAPFVDALASALIMMVLVALFFIVQTATSLSEAAKVYSVSEANVDEDKPFFTPIVYRSILKLDLEANEIIYLINFKFKAVELSSVKKEFVGAKEVMLTVYSKNSEKKSAVNLIRFIKAIKLDSNIKVATMIKVAETGFSKIHWEIKQ